MNEDKIILWNIDTKTSRQVIKDFPYRDYELTEFIKRLISLNKTIIKIEIDLNEHIIEVVTN